MLTYPNDPSESVEPVPIFIQLKIIANIAAIPFVTAVMSVSVPILTILIESSRSDFSEENDSQAIGKKITVPLLIWSIIYFPLNWLNWNCIVHRANGKEDNIKGGYNPSDANDGWHVFLALVGNLYTVTNGLLVTFGAINQFNLNFTLLLLIALIGGIINGVSGMLTEVDFSFHKHVEYCAANNRPIKPLFYQPSIKWFYNYAGNMGAFLRETYPATNAMIRCVVATQFFQRHLNYTSLSPFEIRAINLLALVLIYPASAYVLQNFDIAQLTQSLNQFNRAISLETTLSRSSNKLIRGIGNAINGENFLHLLLKLKLAPEMAVNVILCISAVAFAGLAENGLCTYISCNDPAGIRSGERALLMRYFAGNEQAIELGATLAPYMYSLAAASGLVATFFKKPMLDKQTEINLNRYKVLPVDGDARNNTPPTATH